MEGPWFVETLARNGDVLQRQRVESLPIRIGRGYGNDVIVDDDYAAPSHAVIERADADDAAGVRAFDAAHRALAETADGVAGDVANDVANHMTSDAAGTGLVLRDLGSRNGVNVKGRRVTRIALDSDTVVRIGHTSIRVRAAAHPVAPELPDRTLHRWEGMLPGAAGALLVGGFALFARWISDTQYPEVVRYVEALAWGVAAALLWAGAWALVNRLFGRHARLGRHLFIIGCGTVALGGYALLAATLGYAFSNEAFTHYASHVATALLAGVVYFHLATIKPPSRRRYRWICAGLAVLGSALILVGNVQRTGRMSDELYMAVLMPPQLRVSQDRGIDQFMREVEGMKEGLDRSRGRKPGDDEIDNR